jgi:DNA repair exonuclease SbcCD ATPase subunit
MKENMIQQRENEIKKMEETITFYQNQLDELEEISQEQVFELINKREQFQKNLSNLQRQKLVEYDTAIEKLQREYNDLNTQRSMLQSKKNEFSKILYLDNCPLCKQPVTQQHKDDISQTLQELDNNISSIANSLNQVVQSINQNKDLKNKVYESQDIYFEALRISNLSEEDLSVDLNYLRQVLQKRQSLQNSILQVKSKIENQKNDTSIEERIKEIELEIIEKEKSKTKLDELVKILEVFANTRMLKNVLASTSSELIQSTIKKKYSSLNEVIVTLDEKENLIIQAMNTNNTILPMEDLSRGEDVIAKLTLFSAIRDVISSKFRFNVLFLDEFLDSLDPDNIMFVLPFLQEISKYDKIFVITHNSYALETEIWDTVIDLDLKVTN